MASNIKDGEIQLAPTNRPPAAEYWGDFYSWLMEQAAHVRAGRWETLDRENLAEEIESLGCEQFNKLESALRVLMTYMLKWDHQPKLRSRRAVPLYLERHRRARICVLEWIPIKWKRRRVGKAKRAHRLCVRVGTARRARLCPPYA